jgi:hypothetical protein
MLRRTHAKSTLFIAGILLQLVLAAQNPYGLWTGEMKGDNRQVAYPESRVKLSIEETETGFRGDIQFIPVFFDAPDSTLPDSARFSFTGYFRNNTAFISYDKRNLIYGKKWIDPVCPNNTFRIELAYSAAEGVEKMTGHYSYGDYRRTELHFVRMTSGAGITASSPGILTRLREQQEERKQKEIRVKNPKAPDSSNIVAGMLAKENPEEKASRQKMNERQTVITQTITIPANGEISVFVLDNAVVDNDTVSFYAGGQLVAHRIQVSNKPIKIHIPKPRQSNVLTLCMVAENLGNIPPNTALMILATSGKRYEIELKSDFRQNSGLLLKWEE